MIILWNVRGLNDLLMKQKRLKDALEHYTGNIICLLQTHVTQNNQVAILNKLRPGWKYVDYYTEATLGRIWILRDAKVYVSVFSCSSQSIHCHVYYLPLQQYFFMSAVYASSDELQRRYLWKELYDIYAFMSSDPWTVLGDFNVIKHARNIRLF